jgi:hypothetical protein
MLVSALLESERSWGAARVKEHFGSPIVVSRRLLHHTRSLPGLVALRAGARCKLLHYRPVDDQLEIVVLIACRPRLGIGVRSRQSRRSPEHEEPGESG